MNLGINNQQIAVPRLQGLTKKEEKKKMKTSWIDRETSEIVEEEEKMREINEEIERFKKKKKKKRILKRNRNL